MLQALCGVARQCKRGDCSAFQVSRLPKRVKIGSALTVCIARYINGVVARKYLLLKYLKSGFLKSGFLKIGFLLKSAALSHRAYNNIILLFGLAAFAKDFSGRKTLKSECLPLLTIHRFWHSRRVRAVCYRFSIRCRLVYSNRPCGCVAIIADTVTIGQHQNPTLALTLKNPMKWLLFGALVLASALGAEEEELLIHGKNADRALAYNLILIMSGVHENFDQSIGLTERCNWTLRIFTFCDPLDPVLPGPDLPEAGQNPFLRTSLVNRGPTNGRVEIIANDQGNRITPSYVAFTEEGDRLIGDAAKNQLTSNPKNTVFDAKRMIGRAWDDKHLQKDIKYFPFSTVSRNSKPHIAVDVNGAKKFFSPEEISAMVLVKMKETAEAYLGSKVTEAVVTVPAYFNDAQRAATKDAGTIAGLTIRRIINEPTAAAIAYGLDKKEGEVSAAQRDIVGSRFTGMLGGKGFARYIVVPVNRGPVNRGPTVLALDTEGKVLGRGSETEGEREREREREKERKKERENEMNKKISSGLAIEILDTNLCIENSEIGRNRPNQEILVHDWLITSHVRIYCSTDWLFTCVGRFLVQELVKDYFKKEFVKGINPDEAVAYGASVQRLRYVESISLTQFSLLSNKRSERELWSEYWSDREILYYEHFHFHIIYVVEGERALGKDNHRIGKFDIKGIKPARAGEPQIEVTFEVDNNGVLQVTAKDLGRGASETITITNDQNRQLSSQRFSYSLDLFFPLSFSLSLSLSLYLPLSSPSRLSYVHNKTLSQEDIKRMVEEGEQFAEMDKKIKEVAEAKTALERVAYTVKANLAKDEGQGMVKWSDGDKEIVAIAADNAISFIDAISVETTSVKEIRTQERKLNTIVSQLRMNLAGLVLYDQGLTDYWSGQSRDLNNEFRLVVYLIRSVPSIVWSVF
eukprot:sb/3461816/